MLGNQQPTPPEPMLAGTKDCIVPQVPFSNFKDNPLHNITRHWCELLTMYLKLLSSTENVVSHSQNLLKEIPSFPGVSPREGQLGPFNSNHKDFSSLCLCF